MRKTMMTGHVCCCDSDRLIVSCSERERRAIESSCRLLTRSERNKKSGSSCVRVDRPFEGLGPRVHITPMMADEIS